MREIYKFWIDIPVWELHVDSYEVIATDETEALMKLRNGDYRDLDYSECLEEHRESPRVSAKELIPEKKFEGISKDQYSRTLVDVMDDSIQNSNS